MPTLRILSTATTPKINTNVIEEKNTSQSHAAISPTLERGWKKRCLQMLVASSALPTAMAYPVAPGLQRLEEIQNNRINPHVGNSDFKRQDPKLYSPRAQHHTHKNHWGQLTTPQLASWENASTATEIASTIPSNRTIKRDLTTSYAQTFSKGGDEPNSIILTNRGSNKQSFSFFQNLAPYVPNFEYSYFNANLDPGETALFSFPTGWEGRVQKMTGSAADPATWGEFKFNGFEDLTFFDVSVIRGNNGAIIMRSTDGTKESGLMDDLLSQIPDEYLVLDSNNNKVIGPTEPFTGGTNDNLVNFYRTKVQSGQEYIVHTDNLSTLGTPDDTLNIDIF